METETEKEARALSVLLAGVNKTAFARTYKFPGGTSMISQHCSGHRAISLEAATIYALGLGVDLAQISPRLARAVNKASSVSRRKSAELIDLEFHPDLAPVKRVMISVQAGISGYSIELQEEEGPPIFFRRDWLQSRSLKPENLVAVRVKGRSMEPGLWDGDLVVINLKDKTPVEGEVFAVKHEGNSVIKRMKRRNGQWWLISDSSDQIRHEPKICIESDEIIGRVVYKQSEVI